MNHFEKFDPHFPFADRRRSRHRRSSLLAFLRATGSLDFDVMDASYVALQPIEVFERPSRDALPVDSLFRGAAIKVVGRIRGRMTSTARAIAMRCKTALVDPPRMMVTTMAFSKAFRVMMSRGFKSSSSSRRIAAPAARHSCSFSSDVAGAEAL